MNGYAETATIQRKLGNRYVPNDNGNTERPAVYDYWYITGRSFRKLSAKIGVHENTIRDWAARFKWHERADFMDAEAAQQAQRELIARKVELTRQQIADADELHTISMAAIRCKPPELIPFRDAVAGVKAGYELHRQAEEMPTIYVELSAAPPEKVRTMLGTAERLLEQFDLAEGEGCDPEEETEPEQSAEDWFGSWIGK